MATTASTKFLELRKLGVDAATARQQAYGDIIPPVGTKNTTTPVAPIAPVTTQPVAPTPTPTPAPISVNQQQLLDNQAKRAEMANTGVIPAKKISAPTLVPVPVAPTPTPIKTPEPVKPTTPTVPTIDYNTSTGRESEIARNIEGITASNPNLLTDRNSFNASFGYVSADAGKKAILDSYFTSQQPTPDILFQRMIQGVTVPGNTAGYQQAKTRFDNYSKYVSYTPTQFSTALTSGILLPGTQTYNDLVKNPYIKVQLDKASALNTINGKTVDINKATQTATNDIIDNSLLGQALKDGYISPEEAKALTTTPEISAKEDAIVTLKTDYDTQKAEYDNIRTSVEAELKGTGATRGQIEALIGSRERDQKVGLDIATDTYNNALGQIVDMKKSAADTFNINMTLYGQRQAEQSKIASEQRAMKNALITDQAQFDQKIAQQAQAMNNPTMAISSMIDEYKKLGIPFTSTVQSRLAEFNASGLSLPDYLTQMGQNIQQSPAYQNYQRLQAGQLSDAQKAQMGYTQDLNKMAIQNQYDMTKITTQLSANGWQRDANGNLVNPVTGQTMNTGVGTPVNALSNVIQQVGTNNVQCGVPVNKYLSSLGSTAHVGDTYQSKIDAINQIGISQKPQAGGIFAFTSKDGVGHTGIVTGVNTDGSIQVQEANRENLSTGSQFKAGEYKNTAGMTFSQVPTTQGSYSQDAVNKYALIKSGTTNYQDVVTAFKGTKTGQAMIAQLDAMIQADGGSVPLKPTDSRVIQVQNLKNIADDLLSKDNIGFIDNISGNIQFGSPFNTKTKDYLVKIDNLLLSSVLQNLISARSNGATFGALSEKELALLEISANILGGAANRDEKTKKLIGFSLSEGELKKQLQLLQKGYADSLNKMTSPMMQGNQDQSGTGTNNSYGGITLPNSNPAGLTLE